MPRTLAILKAICAVVDRGWSVEILVVTMHAVAFKSVAAITALAATLFRRKLLFIRACYKLAQASLVPRLSLHQSHVQLHAYISD